MIQRTLMETEHPESGRITRILMEQSVQHFEVADVKTAVRCLLDNLAYTGDVLEHVERLLLREAVRRTRGNHARAGAMLGVSKRMMSYKRNRLQLLEARPELDAFEDLDIAGRGE